MSLANPSHELETPAADPWGPLNSPSPHSIDAERSVLGAILLDSTRFRHVAGALIERDFYRDAHQRVFRRMTALHARGEPVDFLTLKAELASADELEDAGGPAYLAGLTDGLPASVSLDSALRVIKADSVRRQIEQAGRSLAERARKDPANVEDYSTAFAREITHLGSQLQREDLFLNVDAQLAVHAEAVRQESTQRISLGYETLDELIGGARPGEVQGIMARPGVGKTIMACNAANHVGAMLPHVGHVFFSLEQPGAQIVERLARDCFNLGALQVREALALGTLDLETYRLRFRSLLIVDRPGLSVAEISSMVARAFDGPLRECSSRLVTIDHNGLIGGDRKMSAYERVSAQARELKELAKTHAAVVTVAIQVNREAGGDGSKELTLGSARDSGAIEESMDYLRAEALHSAYRKAHPNQVGTLPTEAALFGVREMLAKWRKSNPTPQQMQRTLREKRDLIAPGLQRAAQMYARLYGFGENVTLHVRTE